MIEGIEKLLAIENEQGLDVFKESVSLATLTQNIYREISMKTTIFVESAQNISISIKI